MARRGWGDFAIATTPFPYSLFGIFSSDGRGRTDKGEGSGEKGSPAGLYRAARAKWAARQVAVVPAQDGGDILHALQEYFMPQGCLVGL